MIVPLNLKKMNSLEESKYNCTAPRSLELPGQMIMLFSENRFLKRHLTADCASIIDFRGNSSSQEANARSLFALTSSKRTEPI